VVRPADHASRGTGRSASQIAQGLGDGEEIVPVDHLQDLVRNTDFPGNTCDLGTEPGQAASEDGMKSAKLLQVLANQAA
jgi:hypothetical protein